MISVLRQTGTKLVFTLVVGSLVSCSQSTPTTDTSSTQSPATNSDLPKVVATTSVLCDITKQIAGETIALTCLLKPGVDAHVYSPVPEDRKAIENARLILYSGYDLEPDLIKVIQSTSNPAPKIAVAEEAVTKPIIGEEHEHGHEEHEEHEEGEKEAGEVPDPHVWHDAGNGILMAEAIEQNLAKLAPNNREIYTKNAEALKAELTQIDSWIKSEIATIPKANRKIVTTHDAMGYYAAAYNIPVEGALQGLSTEEKPTATRVKELVDEVKVTKVPTIFAEVVVNPKLIETVAKESNVKLSDRELYSDSLGEPGSEGETYQKMLVANTETIVNGLGGKSTPFAFKSAK
jgi:manganese/iron transport system substrate-binding protein